MVGHVGGGERLGRREQHARCVEGHVAHAHHHGPLARQVEVPGALIGVRVVPAHEVAGACPAGKGFTRDSQVAEPPAPHAVDDRVEVGQQVVVPQIAPMLDVAVEGHARVGGNAVVHPGDALDRLVVGRHAASYETERRGQAVDERHLHGAGGLGEQVLAGIEPGGAGADDGNTKGIGHDRQRGAGIGGKGTPHRPRHLRPLVAG